MKCIFRNPVPLRHLGTTGGTATDTTGGSANEVQTITLSYTAEGTFRLALDGQVTAPLDFDATAAEVESALEDLTTVDNVTVTGSAGGPWTVTFGGSQAGTNVSSLQGDTANLAATSGSTADFVNNYTFDNLGRMTRVEQLGQTGGNDVAKKRVDFSYNALGQ